MWITEQAFAKINLGLEIVARRPDGYHDLISVMQSVSLHDTLYFQKKSEPGITLDTGDSLPADDSNLIIRAAKAYFEASKHPFGVAIRLEKRIPMQAGMGGGSADAAATLRALDRISEAPLGERALCEIGRTLGADVPFCVVGGTQLCEGIGERMRPLVNRLPAYVVVAMSGEGVPTPYAFRALDQKYNDFAAQAALAQEWVPRLVQSIEQGDIALFSSTVYNRFEEVVGAVRPAVGELLTALRELGASVSRMSGSGPSVYALFAERATAERAAEALRGLGATAAFCEFVK